MSSRIPKKKKKLSKSCQNVFKQMSTCQKVDKKLSKKCQKVVKVVITFDPTKQKKSKKKCQQVVKKLSKHWQHLSQKAQLGKVPQSIQ
jgi:predicted translin family RNA/ssDNA-binding protein